MTSVIKDLIARGLMRSAARPANLPQLLATLPKDGVVCRVLPEEWVATGVNDSYYTITHSLLTPGMTQGVFSGVKTWQGKLESRMPKPIPQDLAKKPWRVFKQEE